MVGLEAARPQKMIAVVLIVLHCQRQDKKSSLYHTYKPDTHVYGAAT